MTEDEQRSAFALLLETHGLNLQLVPEQVPLTDNAFDTFFQEEIQPLLKQLTQIVFPEARKTEEPSINWNFFDSSNFRFFLIMLHTKVNSRNKATVREHLEKLTALEPKIIQAFSEAMNQFSSNYWLTVGQASSKLKDMSFLMSIGLDVESRRSAILKEIQKTLAMADAFSMALGIEN